MKLTKLVLSTVAAATLMSTVASASSFDADAVFEKDCQGCHGPAHQGGVGSDLRPGALKKQERHVLRDAILNGIENTAMPQWDHSFSKDDADGMVDWLMDWQDNTNYKTDVKNSM